MSLHEQPVIVDNVFTGRYWLQLIWVLQAPYHRSLIHYVFHCTPKTRKSTRHQFGDRGGQDIDLIFTKVVNTQHPR